MNTVKQKTVSATLYEDNNPNAARSIRVEIKDGLVTFEPVRCVMKCSGTLTMNG